MAQSKVVQTDFTTGEISPLMSARTDVESWKHGAKEITNAYPVPHGAAKGRRGTRFVSEVKDSTRETKLIPFIYSRNESYIVLLNAGVARFVTNGGWVLDGIDPYELAIPYQDNEFKDLRFTQVNNILYIVHPNYSPMQLKRIAENNWTLTEIPFEYYAITDQWYENSKIRFKIISGTTDFASGDSFSVDPVGSVTWTNRNLPETRNWCDVVYGDKAGAKFFVGVADNSNRALSSEDGINWAARDLPSVANWVAVAFGNEKWVTVAGSNSGKAAYSTDAINWSASYLGARDWHSLAFGDGIFVTLGYGTNKAAYSSDGITWTESTLPFSGEWISIAYGNGMFVAACANSLYCATSNDGITWTQRTMYTSSTWESVTYGNGRFVMISTLTNIANWSSDGITWYSSTLPGMYNWREVAYGNNTFVATAAGTDKYATSSDGSTWNEVSMPSSNNWEALTFGQGRFVSLCYNSNAAASGEGGAVTKDQTNVGNGTVAGVTFKDSTQEVWSISCVYADADRQEWKVSGSISGELITTWRAGNRPKTVVFHEQRLYFGGTNDNPQTIWGSAIGDTSKFTLGTKDTDGLQFTIASNQYDELIHLVSGKYLIPLTYGGEFAMMGSTTTGITPSTVRIAPQTYHGSNSMLPIKIGNEVLFTQRDGKKVRAISYVAAEDANVAPEITVLAEHLFKSRIKEASFAQDPDYLSWWILEDGTLRSLNHQREFSMTGWSSHNTKNGKFINVATIPEATQDTIYFVVERIINGNIVKYVEYFDYNTDVYTDCSLILSNNTPITAFNGLSHLEGQEVTIVADGKVHPNKTVYSGTITLDYAASQVIVGLSFTPKIVLYTPIIADEKGTSQGGKISISQVIVNLYQTLGLTINKKEVPFRRFNVDPLGIPLDLYTGSKEVKMSGWGSEENVELTQPLPMPWIVLSTVLYVTSKD